MPVQSLAVVVPVYNEEESLPSLFTALHELRTTLAGRRLRIVFVDDHSDDRSPKLIRQACAENDWLSYVRLSRRLGSHVAVIAGLEQCDEDCAAFMAADLQDPPKLLRGMMDLCDQGCDVVWGVRDSSNSRSMWDSAGASLFYLLVQALVHPRDLPRNATFALLSRRGYRRLVHECAPRPILHVNIAQLGYPGATVTFWRPPRQAGRSKWTFLSKVGALHDAIISSIRFSRRRERPLYQIQESAGLVSRSGDAV